MDTPLYCFNESLLLAFPECTSNRQATILCKAQMSFSYQLLTFYFTLGILCQPLVGRSFSCKTLWLTLTHSGEVSTKLFVALSARSRMKSIQQLLLSVSHSLLISRFLCYCRVLIKIVNDEHKNLSLKLFAFDTNLYVHSQTFLLVIVPCFR